MPYLFVILIKINLVLAFFAIAYYLILRRLTFYVLNRIFLVLGILFSSLYPFIDLTEFFNNQQQLSPQITSFVPAIKERVQELSPVGFIAQYGQLISILFYTGVAAMTVRLILQFVSLYRLHKNSVKGLVNDVPVRILTEPVNPFSFWQTIYINPSLHTNRDLQSILAHEDVHVKQWHTLDILLAELSVVFYWFNPGVWLMNKAVKENLEFITDEKVLKRGVDKKAYQYSLLTTGKGAAVASFTNSFTIADLKKRIRMMNARRSSRLTLSRYAFVLPVLLLTALSLTVSKKKVINYFAPVAPQIVYAKLTGASANERGTATKRMTNRSANPHAVHSLRLANATSPVDEPNNYAATDTGTLPSSPAIKIQQPVQGISGNALLYKKVYASDVHSLIPTASIQKDSNVAVKLVYSLRLRKGRAPGTISPAIINYLPKNTRGLSLPQNTNDNNIKIVQGYPAPRNQITQQPGSTGTGNVRIVQGYPFRAQQ
jgi:beta-lactamase regulating signal transducer with metallopeptidase domain